MHVLLIEGRDEDIRHIRSVLERGEGPADFQVSSVASLEAGMASLEHGRVDVVLLGLGPPEKGRWEALRTLVTRWPSVPVVAVTDLEEEDAGLAAIQPGAQDYLPQGRLYGDTLKRSIRYAAERKRAEEALRESERRYRLLADNAADVIWTMDLNLRLTYLSPSIERLLGVPAPEAMEMPMDRVLTPPSLRRAMEILAEEMEAERRGPRAPYRSRTFELEQFRSDGSTVWTEMTASFLRNPDGEPVGVQGIARDVSERKRAEEELRIEKLFSESVINSMPAVFYVMSDRGELLRWNRNLEVVSGYSAEEFRGADPLAFFRGEDRKHIAEGVRTAFERGTATVEADVVSRDGRRTPYLFTGLRATIGERECLIGMGVDITLRRKAEDALRESEEKYRLLVENANDCIFILQDGRMKFHNKRTEQLMEQPAERIEQAPFSEHVHPEDLPNVLKIHRNRMAGRPAPSTYSFRIRTGSGADLFVQVNAIRIQWGERPAVLCFLRDITELKQLESHLRQSQKMEAIGTLAGGIAHDFNNILAIINGYSELLRSSLPTTIEIRRKFDVASAPVRGDATQIHQVLMNLGSNAGHAMRGKGGVLEVGLREAAILDRQPDQTLPPGRYIELRVRDTGTGMAKKVLDRIFDPFFTTKQFGEGTGMGLSVVHGIVKSHQGDIQVQSEPGRGATFRILLPLLERLPAEKPRPAPPAFNGQANILFVDDEEPIVQLYQQMLEGLGHRVTGSTDSRRALEVFRRTPEGFDLVITDLTMPHLTGVDLLQRISEIRPDVPLVLITGFQDALSPENFLRQGFQAVLMKPILMHEMSEAVQKVLEVRPAP